jgi:hypothetical protein
MVQQIPRQGGESKLHRIALPLDLFAQLERLGQAHVQRYQAGASDFQKLLSCFKPFFFHSVCLASFETNVRGLAIAGLAAVVLQVLLYAKADWRQGESWGPRWLTDVVPLLVGRNLRSVVVRARTLVCLQDRRFPLFQMHRPIVEFCTEDRQSGVPH